MAHSRRELIGGIGLGLALAGAGAPAAFGATRRIGYAVVGLGSYATRQIMPNFAGCETARLVALVSGTPAKLDQYGAQYNIPKTHRYSYADFDRIRDNPDIDAVYIILPNSMHAEYSIRAARRQACDVRKADGCVGRGVPGDDRRVQEGGQEADDRLPLALRAV